MIKKVLLFTLFVSSISFSNAASTISFSGSGARAIGFLNGAGVAVAGMKYGILIDTQNNGFSPGSYDLFDFNNNPTSPFTTSVPLIGGGASGEVYYTAASNNTTLLSVSASGADAGGGGAIASLTNVPTTTELGLTGSIPFGIIWFDESTPSAPTYGFYTHSSFVLPAAGPSNAFTTPFTGTSGVGDAPKFANISFAAVPEPSRMMLLGFGLVGFFFRRRR
jgi:hypothetical protein